MPKEKTKIFDLIKFLSDPDAKNLPTKAEYFNKRLEQLEKSKNKDKFETEIKRLKQLLRSINEDKN